jgi:hypothetical protein
MTTKRSAESDDQQWFWMASGREEYWLSGGRVFRTRESADAHRRANRNIALPEPVKTVRAVEEDLLDAIRIHMESPRIDSKRTWQLVLKAYRRYKATSPNRECDAVVGDPNSIQIKDCKFKGN